MDGGDGSRHFHRLDLRSLTTGARTRERLISVAAAVIAEKGYDRAPLEEIAARAGMTRGAVYGNFKNKEELFLALIASRWKPIVPPLKPGARLKNSCTF